MKKTLAVVLVILMAMLSVFAYAEPEKTITQEKDGIVVNEDGEFEAEFPETIEQDGAIYTLSSVEYENNLDAEPAVYQLEPKEVTADDAKEPEKTVEVDGITYQLKPDSVKKTERIEQRSVPAEETMERDVTAVEDYEPEVEVTVIDEVTGEEVTAVIPYAETEPLRTEWVSDLTTEMRFYNYEADAFTFGNTIIMKNDAVPLTPDQFPMVMSYLNMDTSQARITGAVWGGAPYQDGDTLTRVAVLTGETLHQINTDIYRGEVELEPITYVSYEAEYEEVGESLELKSTAKATATYTFKEMVETEPEPEPEAPKKNFFQTPAGVVTLVGIVALAVGLVAVLFIIAKKKKNKNDESEKS